MTRTARQGDDTKSVQNCHKIETWSYNLHYSFSVMFTTHFTLPQCPTPNRASNVTEA